MRRSFLRPCGLLVLAACLAWYLWSQSAARDYAMPDGSVIRLEQVSFGAEEHIYLRTPLEKRKAMLPLSWQAKLPGYKPPGVGRSWSMNAVIRPDEDALYIYISRRDPGKGYISVDARAAQVVDEDGCIYAATQAGGYDDGHLAAGRPRTGRIPLLYSVGWFRFEAFPRHDKKFRFLVGECPQGPLSKSGPYAEFTVANPAPRPRIAQWPVEPLPIARKQDHVTFILSQVTIKTNAFPDRLFLNLKWKAMHAEYAFTEDGQPSTNWEALETDLSDSSGNFISGASGYQGSLCPRESAWKMRVKFFGSEKSRAASNAVWTLRGVAVPAAGQFTLLDRSNVLQGVLVKAVTFGGAGDFTYFNNIALAAAPPQEPITNDSARIISMPRSWTGKRSIVQPTFSVHANGPHLAVSFGDLSGDQRLTVRAVDDQGREFYGYNLGWRRYGPAIGHKLSNVNYLNNWSLGEGNFLAFDLPADVKTVDLTFCVHTCRTAEFVFQPPIK